MKEAIHQIVASWKNVSSSCIRNCFQKCGFKEEPNEPEEVFETPDAAIEILKKRDPVCSNFSFEDYAFND